MKHSFTVSHSNLFLSVLSDGTGGSKCIRE